MNTSVSVTGSKRPKWPATDNSAAEDKAKHPEYGQKLRNESRAAGLSRKSLADKSGYSESQVKRARSGDFISFDAHTAFLKQLNIGLAAKGRPAVRIQYPWGAPSPEPTPSTHQTLRLVPTTFPPRILKGKWNMPQAADHWEIPLDAGRLKSLKCVVTTDCPYFRFGFKLLALDGKVFGDGSIQSQDANLVIHIARNAWPSPGITANDLFLTVYQNGKRTKKDARLFPVKPKLKVEVELLINNAFVASFTVNGRSRCEQVVPPEICYRAVMLGWDDHWADLAIKVTEIEVTTLK